MGLLLSLPVLILGLILQMSVFRNLPLLLGTADLVLLVLAAWSQNPRVTSGYQWAILGGVIVGAVSKQSMLVPIASCVFIVWVSRSINHIMWQVPVLSLMITVILGTFFQHFLSIVFIQFSGTPLPFWDSIGYITLPSMMLNMILTIPVYILMKDLSRWIYPDENEI